MALWLMTGTGHADSLESLIERLDRLEQENRQLRKEIDALKAARQETTPRAAAPASESPAAQFVHVDSEYGYEILDPTTNINRKQRLILDRKKDGTLAPDRLHVQGAITAIANYQSSNRDDKFGYLMRHPTAANQVGDTVSEATIHSAQLGFTGTLGGWIRVNGFAPLNFISGGSVRNDMGEVISDQTISDSSAHSDVIMVGVNVAF